MSDTLKRVIMMWCGVAMLVGTAACSSGSGQSNLVAQAYDTSGTLSGVPYKRTIFSSTDF